MDVKAKPIRPVHSSIKQASRMPPRMTITPMTQEQVEFLDAYAIDIFTDCVNSGNTFQCALTALYLSGLENGISLAQRE